MITESEHCGTLIRDRFELRRRVEETVNTTPVVDVHTHLLPSTFGQLSLFGIDDLLTYHYLVAELFRSTDLGHEYFWKMSKTDRADLIWRTLFVENTPLSEAARGVVTVLDTFGLNPNATELAEARDFFDSRNLAEHIDRVFKVARVDSVVMTNDPFSTQEAAVWESDATTDPRFHAALRMDRLVNEWQSAVAKIASLGYHIDKHRSNSTTTQVRRFLDKWIDCMNPVYMAVSLSAEFKFPAGEDRDWVLKDVVLPCAREHELPVALMIGVRREVNPALQAAGDGLGRADVRAVEGLCEEYPDVRFLASFLSRENQHELCVAAQKFNNLMPFGCWWFLNNPSIVAEITHERLELLGTSFIPQHSDARILEQLIYKWSHARVVIAECLCTAYERLLASGRPVSRREIERDVTRLFSGNFRECVGGLPLVASAQAEETDVFISY